MEVEYVRIKIPDENERAMKRMEKQEGITIKQLEQIAEIVKLY